MKNEAHARIKINQLLSEAGWLFFDSDKGAANILLEHFVKISEHKIDEWGNDYEKIKGGSLEFYYSITMTNLFVFWKQKKKVFIPW